MTHGEYEVVGLAEGALAKGLDWVFIEYDGSVYFAIKRSHVTLEAMADAWGAFRVLEESA